MEKTSTDYTRATSNSWLAKHWKLSATPLLGYATKKLSMTKSFVASSTTSTSLTLASNDEDNALRVGARQTTTSNARVRVPSFAVAIVSSDHLRSLHFEASPIPLSAQPGGRDRQRLSELMPVMNQLRDDMRFSLQRFRRLLNGDAVQLFNRVIGQLQVSSGYILSQMLNR